MISNTQANNILNRFGQLAVFNESNELIGLLNNLRDYINEEPEIKIIYEYKLYDTATKKYMNASSWDSKGKTYKNRNALAVRLGTEANERGKQAAPKYLETYMIERDQSGNRIYLRDTNGKYLFHPSYIAHREFIERLRNDRKLRAEYLPDTWIVRCIPVNTKSDIIELSAREFYLGKKI